MTPFIIKRGSKEYKVNIDVSTEGISTLYLEDAIGDEDNLKIRRYVTKLQIVFDESLEEGCTGKAIGIGTWWRKARVTPSGKIIPIDEEPELMVTNEQDVKSFGLMLGNPILMAGINGLVRDLLGFNHFPVFNTNGSIKVLTPFEETTEPTNNYKVWKAGDDLPESIIEPTI